MSERRLVAGNWKMNGSRSMASSLVPQLLKSIPAQPGPVEIVICPPAVLLTEVGAMLRDRPVSLGAQDCHDKPEGAYTGDLSAAMLADAGCRYVILGHSERRQHHGETNADVAAKVEAALAAGVTPILCVGESLEQRRAGEAEPLVAAQLRASLPARLTGELAVAYEPIWAIGTGLTPSVDDITSMHAALSETLKTIAPSALLLYGGSVKAANAREILDLPGVDGVLVGGASLNADEFSAIVAAAYAD